MSNRISLATVLATSVIAVVAHADVSQGVISTFRGQIVITKDDLPDGKGDKDTIAKIKAAQLKVLEGKPNDDGMIWHFHYTAFLNRTGNSSLKMEFYTDDKDHKYVANQSLSGVDPKNGVLSGDISISEDEGLNKGKAYVIKLETEKDQPVSETHLTFK